jgi:hypothetical protein
MVQTWTSASFRTSMSLDVRGQRLVWVGFREEGTWSVLSEHSLLSALRTHSVPVASGCPAGNDTADGSETNG